MKKSSNPYQNFPDSAFWARSVAKNFQPVEVINPKINFLQKKSRVTSAGSCFASNLIPYIESAGLTYIRTEILPSVLQDLGQNLGYANFSANYGNIYTARQLNQLYQRSLGYFRPIDDRFREDGKIIDLFRPGLKFASQDDSEFEFITSSHLQKTREAFESADIFVFTLGLTEAWVSKLDGAVYPSCPGTISGKFDPNKYEFSNFDVTQTIADLSNFIEILNSNNPKIKFLLSVSPVPLVATATKSHVLEATTYSKAVLRVAANEVTKLFKNVFYFPAYEIITGPQAPDEFFETDKRNVSKLGVEVVMRALLESNGLKSPNLKSTDVEKSRSESIVEASHKISYRECDELFLDINSD